MTEPAADIAAAKEAWQRLRNSRASFDDWLAVGRALVIGRAECMKLAQANRPLGAKYNRAMGLWLAGNGLDGINNQERYRIILVVENLPAILAWRESLGEDMRRKLNHPGAIWAHWSKAGTVKPEVVPRRQPIARREPVRNGSTHTGSRGVFWTQEHLRRAHRAMLDSKSSDFLKLARCALEAAIRNEDDLFALIDTPGRPPPAIAAALAA